MTTYEQDAERYRIAAEHAGNEWVCKNPIGFRALADDAMLDYCGERGGFRRRMEGLTRLSADAAGFPRFYEWLALEYPSPNKAAA